MNEPFDSSEHEKQMRDGDPMSIEQQLQAFRPRAPRLNWDEIAPTTSQALSQVQPQAQLRAGFTFQQMCLAIAASWIVGAIVGGGCIFWSMPSREDAVVNAGPIQTSVEVAESPSNTLPKTSSDMAQVNAPASDALAPMAIDLGDASWRSSEPLSVRSSLNSAKSPSRLTAMRSTASSESTTSISSQVSPEPAFAPTPISNRQQLMQQYLKKADKQVY